MNRADENLMSEAEGWAAKESKAQARAEEEAQRKPSKRPSAQPRSQPQESNDWKAQMRNFSNQAVSIKKRVAFKSQYHQEVQKSNINEIGKGLDIQATAEQQKNLVVKFEGNKLVVRKTTQEDVA